MSKNPHAEGASKSLNATIREIEAVLSGLKPLETESPMRKELRTTIAKLTKRWFRRGFRRGCIEVHRGWKPTGKFPREISYDARRDFFDGQNRSVRVTWKKP